MEPKEALDFLSGAPGKSAAGSLTPVTDTEMAKNLQPEPKERSYLTPDEEKLRSDAATFPVGQNDALIKGLGAKEQYIRNNTTGDVPLDIDTGIDTVTRLGMAARRAKEDQLKYLQGKFGEQAVRMSDDGGLIIRVMDSETGKPRDVLADERRMTVKDLTDLAGMGPEIVAGALSARGGNPRGFIQVMAKLGKMAAYTEGAGALKDVGTRIYDKSDIRPGEILEQRGGMALGDVMFGLAGVGAAKMGLKALSPFSSPGPLQADLQAAQEYFKKKGYTLPATPGELTGNSFLQRSEAMAKQKPGSSVPFEKIVEQRNEELKKIQNVALGLPENADAAAVAALPTEEAVGERAIAALGKKLEPVKAELQGAREDVLSTGTSRIKDVLAKASGKGHAVDTVEVGKSLRESALQRREAFREQAAKEFGAVYDHPLSQQQNLPAGKLANQASKILDSMPAKDVVQQVPTGTLDEAGNAILRDEKGREILKQFVPTDVVSKLKELSTLGDQNFKLGDLIKMRTDVSNEIAKGEAIPGVDTKYLTEIRNMLTGTIESGLDDLGDPALKKAWKTANDNYAKGVKPFKQAGVAELFRDAEQSNFLGDNEVIQRALSGGKATDIYNAYKSFYGPNSSEMTGVRRSVVDKLLNKSTNVSNDYVSGSDFVKNLQALFESHPQIATDVIQEGNRGKLMHMGLMVKSAEGKLGTTLDNLEVYLPADKLEKELLSGELTAQKIVALAEKEKALNKVYQNDILKQIGTGRFIGDNIEPTDFVRKFSTQAAPRDVGQVLNALSDRPEIVEEIRRKTVKQILDKSYAGATALDNPALVRGTPRELSAKGIQNALGDATQRERYKAILGAETYQDLEMASKALAPSDVKDRAFSAAGGLSAGSQISGLIERGEMKYVDRALSNFVLATIYASPMLRNWAKNNLVTPERSAAAINYVIASTPFVEAMAREYGSEAKGKMMVLKAGLDRYTREGAASQPSAKSDGDRRKEFETFLKAQ